MGYRKGENAIDAKWMREMGEGCTVLSTEVILWGRSVHERDVPALG